jgi:hypothetical protein
VPQLASPVLVQTCAGSAAPVGTFVHAPIEPASAHERHALVHAVAQQTPCAQFPDAHSPPSEQKAPLGFLPHELSTHTLPAEQLASVAHAPKHCAPLHANGMHGIASGAMQAPVALHVDSGVNTLFSQRAPAQMVPGRCRLQAPAPSHVPSVPHVSAGCAGQLSRGSCVPAATGVHTPSADGSAQLRQPPLHASAQQTPSTQNPDTHSSSAAHTWPLALRPQLPLSHAWPATQSALLVHRLTHALSAQRYGAQSCTPGMRQLPRPLQVPAVLSRSPAHDGGTHTVSGT